jgi:hypothetical protein
MPVNEGATGNEKKSDHLESLGIKHGRSLTAKKVLLRAELQRPLDQQL